MPVTLKISETESLIVLEGAIDIASAAELKKLLLDALNSAREVRVSLEKATELDITAVQLLWAAERQARGAGVAFALAGQLPEPVSVALGDAGLMEFAGQAGGR